MTSRQKNKNTESGEDKKLVINSLYSLLTRASNLGLGAIFWLIVAKIASPSELGKAVSLVSVITVTTSLLSLGIPYALTRHIGEEHKNPNKIAVLIPTGLAIGLGMSGIGAIALYSLSMLAGFSLLKGNEPLAVFLLVTAIISSIFASMMMGFIDFAPIFFASLTGNIGKIAVAVALVLLKLGWIGIAASYATLNIAIIATGIRYYIAKLKLFKKRISLKEAKKILEAGISIWLPSLISLMSSPALGVITVYLSTTASKAGLFYVAYIIAGVSFAIASATLTVLLPHLASLEKTESRINTLTRGLRVGIALSTPIAVVLVTYSKEILSLIGKSYTAGNTILVIATLAILVSTIASGLQTYLYASAKYVKVLLAGLIGNTTTLLLYITLTPKAGGMGAATAILLGGTISTILYLYLSGRKTTSTVIKASARASSPLLIAPIIILAKPYIEPYIHWIFAASIILLALILLEARIGALKKEDIKLITRAVVPEKIASKIPSQAKILIDAIFA